MYTYTWYQWLTFFYIYCFFGWIFESSYVSLKQRRFVNRGFLRLPMLPLYGSGAIMMLWVSMPVQDNLFLTWCAGVIGATCLEYVTGYVMERLFKVRYWDYSNQKFNIHGYICLTSSIAWGFLTILMTEVIHKPIEHLVLNLPPVLEWCLLGAVSGCFVMDTIQSTKEALGLAKALESVAKLRADLEDMQVQLALLKAETMQNVENAKEELLDAVAENVENSRQLAAARKEMLATAAEIHREAIAARKEEFVEAVEAHKEAVAARKEELAEAMELHKETVAARKEELAASFDAKKAALAARISSLNEKIADTTSRLNSRKTIARPSILQRNPSAVSRRFADAWKELYKEWEDEKHA